MFVCWVCCVLSGRGLCDELITRPEESYRLWRVVVCDQETSRTRRSEPALGCRAREREKKKSVMIVGTSLLPEVTVLFRSYETIVAFELAFSSLSSSSSSSSSIRHELGLDRPVSASCNSLFKRLPSRLRPFGL
jgi:hypothetical protein